MHEENIEKIQQFHSRNRRLPSYGELADLCGYKSKSSAYSLAEKLIEAGYIGRDSAGKLVPTAKLTDIKVLGDVTAGFPSPAEEELVDTMSLDDFLVENREATFILKVDGDSMIDAGIQDGDLVLVERTDTANVGQIIIAEVDNEFTMKYLREKSGAYYLEADNDNYADIYPEGELRIAGVVKGVVRKYD
ncbi:MAG: LexA family transcriptional regulator [Candidatus Paceibacterota bacterium]